MSHVSELLFWKLAVVSTVMVVTEHLHSGLKETTISITDSLFKIQHNSVLRWEEDFFYYNGVIL